MGMLALGRMVAAKQGARREYSYRKGDPGFNPGKFLNISNAAGCILVRRSPSKCNFDALESGK